MCIFALLGWLHETIERLLIIRGCSLKKKTKGQTRKHNMLMPLIANMHAVKRKFQAEVNYATIKQGDTVILPPSY